MAKRLIFIIVLISGLLCTADGQFLRDSKLSLNNRVQDDVLGISFDKVGIVTRLDSSTYNISMLSSESSPTNSAFAQVSGSNRLFIALPGSYGGRLYLNSPLTNRLFQNRVMIDSVNTGHLNFHRGYWMVYAGMGMWDCVINCYVQKNGRYYIVSLVQDKPMGKPGEIVDGKPLKAGDLKLKIVSSLQDTTNNIIRKFNKLLSSFRISN